MDIKIERCDCGLFKNQCGLNTDCPKKYSFLTPMPSHKPYFNPDGIHKQIERLQLINSLEHVTVFLPK
jgi:hypothetical protein